MKAWYSWEGSDAQLDHYTAFDDGSQVNSARVQQRNATPDVKYQVYDKNK